MGKFTTRFLQIAVPLGIGVFLIWYIFQSFTPAQLAETKEYFSEAKYGFVILSVFLSLLSHISRAYRWNFMLEPLGYRPKLLNNFMALSVAYLMNLLIPKSGEVSRALILDKYEAVPFQKGFGTIISERIVDLIFLLVYTAIAVSIKFEVLYSIVEESIPKNSTYLLAVGIIICTILFYLFTKYSDSIVNQKIINFIVGLKEGIFSIITMRRKKEFLFQSILIWGLYLLSFYASMQALPQTAAVSFSTVIIVFVVGSFTYAFTNSGFGTYPVAIAAILSIFEVSKTVGIAFGWIAWLANISSIIFIGVLALLILPWYNRRIKNQK